MDKSHPPKKDGPIWRQIIQGILSHHEFRKCALLAWDDTFALEHYRLAYLWVTEPADCGGDEVQDAFTSSGQHHAADKEDG